MEYISKETTVYFLQYFKKQHQNLPQACLKMLDITENIIKQVPTLTDDQIIDLIIQAIIDEIRIHREKSGLDPCWCPTQTWYTEQATHLTEQINKLYAKQTMKGGITK